MINLINIQFYVFFTVFISSPTLFSEESPGLIIKELLNNIPENSAISNKALIIAKKLKNKAYQSDPLGEGGADDIDKDPIWDLNQFDCVTYIEQVYALASSKNADDFQDHLNKIRYKGGKISFVTRNHFFTSDWILNNSRNFMDVTPILISPQNLQSETRRLFKKSFFGKHQITANDQSYSQFFIPKSKSPEAFLKMKSGDIIAFVGKIDSIFVIHTGLIEIKEKTNPVLWHASSKHKKVVDENLAAYLNRRNPVIGFIVLRPVNR